MRQRPSRDQVAPSLLWEGRGVPFSTLPSFGRNAETRVCWLGLGEANFDNAAHAPRFSARTEAQASLGGLGQADHAVFGGGRRRLDLPGRKHQRREIGAMINVKMRKQHHIELRIFPAILRARTRYDGAAYIKT